MLRVIMSVSAEGAEQYFDTALKKGDYYMKEQGVWGGKGAERLGLKGEVTRGGFLALASNKIPGTKESLPKTLYDLVRAEQFVPFSIVFAAGQRFEIKTREHISLGPVTRSDVEELKTLIVWDDDGKWKAVYMRAILKIGRLQS
jgi:hypothetical protein